MILLPEFAAALDPAKNLSQFYCQNSTRQGGLPANGINAITQTKNGYLWLGTQKGLVRFDGNEFKLFPLPPQPQFRRQSIATVAAAADGGLWFGIHNSAFGHFDGEDTFRTSNDPWVSPIMNVIASYVRPDGSLWIGADTGAGWFAPGRSNVAMVLDQTGAATALCEGAQGRIWIGTSDHGLFCWQQDELTAFPEAALKSSTIRAVAEDAAGQLWVATSTGLRLFSVAGQPLPLAYASPLEIRALLADRRGAVWIGTTGDGLGRYFDGQMSFLRKRDGLVNDFVTALFEDREGSLWIGTREGLSQLTDVKLPIWGPAEGLATAMIHGVAPARGDGLWAATSQGLARIGSAGVTNYGAAAGLTNTYLKRAFESRNGEVYVIGGSKTIDILMDGKVQASLGNGTWPTAFTEDATGVIAAIGGDLFRVSRQGLAPYPLPAGTPPAYWIRDLATARDGALLVASVNGVFRFQAGDFQYWSATTGLADSSAHCIIEDNEGAIWVGLTTGLARIKADRISTITRTNGLFENYVFALVLDDHDSMWVNSSSGIFRISLAQLNALADSRTNQITCVPFDGLDAVKTTDTTEVEYSAARTTDDRIWFPSPLGVIQIDPHNLITNPIAPPVQIQEVRLNGVTMSPHRPVTVGPGKGEAALRYVALSFLAPQRIRYRYRLEGYDTGWVEAEGRQEAVYTNLKPGRYRFQVQACNADGVWNETGDGFEFELPPYYYQTAWFQGLLGLLGLTVLLNLYLWRFRHLQRQEEKLRAANERLESRIQERTRELAEQRNLLRTLIDHLPDNVFVKDPRSRIVLSNQAHAQTVGAASPDGAVGKTDFDFFPRELAQKYYDDEQSLLQSGQPFNGEESIIAMATGEPRWSRTTKVPLHDPDGKIIGLAGINRDITERKQWEARLEALHQQLVEASRHAGMAEVATSVLHNVGNVLNSVNISATVVSDRVKNSATAKVGLLLQLLREHKADLATFLTADENGRKLVDYLEVLTEHLGDEKERVLEEIACLVRNIEHIKEIVAMQQAYARVAGVHEILNPVELVEDALRMQAASFVRHEVQLRREFAVTPSVTLDRHKVMQIVINLLQNARWACEKLAGAGEVVVKVGPHGADRVRIEVADNGVGIPPDNLTRIFAHGFTTRSGGHGFALHSGALAAKEMGGSLIAESDGPGKGARFILELPCKFSPGPADDPANDSEAANCNPGR